MGLMSILSGCSENPLHKIAGAHCINKHLGRFHLCNQMQHTAQKTRGTLKCNFSWLMVYLRGGPPNQPNIEELRLQGDFGISLGGTAPFLPCQLRGGFYLVFHFFPIASSESEAVFHSIQA